MTAQRDAGTSGKRLAYISRVPGVVKTARLQCFTAGRSMSPLKRRIAESSGNFCPVSGSTSVIGSLKSATQGMPLKRCKDNPINCAVAIGNVDQITSGEYRRIICLPRITAPGHQLIQRSGSAVQRK